MIPHLVSGRSRIPTAVPSPRPRRITPIRHVAAIVAAQAALYAGGPSALALPVKPTAVVREYLMGTIAEVRIYDRRDPAGLRAALDASRAELHAIDRLMAVQRSDSDVSRLNASGSGTPVQVDARVVEVLEAARAVSELTDGAFDVTVLPAAQAWGFTTGTPRVPDVTPVIAGFSRVVVDAAGRTVTLTDPRAQVDLGGIGKGYALDRVRGILRAHGVRSAYLDLGGEVATIGHPPDAPYWRIGIRHPRNPEAVVGAVELGEGAVSTSGDGEQFVIANGTRFGHIFDPRTGRPARALVSATVVATSATLADALSTAAVVLGPVASRAALRRVGAEGIFVDVGDDGKLAVDPTAGARFHRLEGRTQGEPREAPEG